MAKSNKNQQTEPRESAFSEFVENAKWPLGIVGFLAGVSVLTYAFNLYEKPTETLQQTKKFVGQVKDIFASEARITPPDCVNELSKTIVSNGKKYTITCAPN
ncbi:MAG: hypothetical protein JWO78_1838 [Micavibrio sp.]|nr:hypothetical protein [Micavibrio sp.]